MRRQLIHHQPSQRAVNVGSEVAKSWHLHFCSDRNCRVVYEDYGCADASKNGRCHTCRGLRRPVWHAARDPRPCCTDNCVQVTDKGELVRYRLAGPGPWFQCKTCARCHGWPTPERKT